MTRKWISFLFRNTTESISDDSIPKKYSVDGLLFDKVSGILDQYFKLHQLKEAKLLTKETELLILSEVQENGLTVYAALEKLYKVEAREDIARAVTAIVRIEKESPSIPYVEPSEYDDDSVFTPEQLEIRNRHWKADDLNKKGQDFENAGNIDAALECYEECIKLQYDYLNPYDRLMIIYRRTGQPDKEVETIDTAVSFFQKKEEGKYLKAIHKWLQRRTKVLLSPK
jgi:tetratricopeptide (TPR) repeat protein